MRGEKANKYHFYKVILALQPRQGINIFLNLPHIEKLSNGQTVWISTSLIAKVFFGWSLKALRG